MARLWSRLSGFMSDTVGVHFRYFLGSPRAVLRLQRIFVMEALFASLFHCCSLGLLLLSAQEGLLASWEMLAVLLFGLVVSLARVPHLVVLERRCYKLNQNFEQLLMPVANEMTTLLRSTGTTMQMLLSGFMTVWYCGCVALRYTIPPCNAYTLNATRTANATSISCESLELLCTLLFWGNFALFVCSILAREAVWRFRSDFVPAQGGRMPPDLLDQLPVFNFEDETCGGSDLARVRRDDTTCTVCLNDFCERERIRMLPCGHCFHEECANSWLQRASTCPMRCPADLWEYARNARVRAGLPPGGTASPAGRGRTSQPQPFTIGASDRDTPRSRSSSGGLPRGSSRSQERASQAGVASLPATSRTCGSPSRDAQRGPLVHSPWHRASSDLEANGATRGIFDDLADEGGEDSVVEPVLSI